VKWTVCLVSLFAIALSGCAIFGGRVDDLAFVSIEPHPLHGRLSDLRLKFSSNQNLRVLSQRYETDGAYADISLCPYRSDPSVGTARVLHNDIDLDARPMRVCIGGQCALQDDTPEMRAEVAGEHNTHGPFIYEADFAYSRQWKAVHMEDGGWFLDPMPLPSTPQDLCVQITGPSMFGGLRSNEFVIPKDELVRALKSQRTQPLGSTWIDDPGRLKCEASVDKDGPHVVLSLASYFGDALVVHRLADDAWFALITSDGPADMRDFMQSWEYSRASRVELPPDLTGYRWSPTESGQQKVFARAGDYIFYSSGHFVGTPDLGCRVSLADSVATGRKKD